MRTVLCGLRAFTVAATPLLVEKEINAVSGAKTVV